MRKIPIAIFLLIFISVCYAQNNVSTEGGNISAVDLNASSPTEYWAGIVGWMGGGLANISGPVSTRNATNATIYTNYPNGTYAVYFNATMIITRLPEKPDPAYIFTPNESDFNESGMFENFTVFTGINYTSTPDSPLNTFCAPCVYTTCYIYGVPIGCPYILLNPSTPVAVLKFFNGTTVEPLFVGTIVNLPGYNGSNFDFEYIVPAREFYYFYLYKRRGCNLTVWIDDVQTTTFSKTGVPYKVEVLVRDNATLAPIANATVRSVEKNGRNILYPIMELGKAVLGFAEARTNETGRAIFALEPTRYNIPDVYEYETYIEVDDSAYYCVRNLSIASYGSLSPTYRTSLVNDDYGREVKNSVQSMNSLTSTATKWTAARKMRVANINVSTNGSHTTPLPTLKAGAPNLLNITAYNDSNIINATVYSAEENGLIIFVPLQPDKELYNNTGPFYTNETIIIIPTRYNNNANLTLVLAYEGNNFATLTFNIDSVLEEPSAGEGDMDDSTYALISSALQNINMVLSNIGKSISTV